MHRLALLLGALPLLAAAPALAAPGDATLKAGYLVQRVPFDAGYGAFLKERFGAEFVDLGGIALSGVYWAGDRNGLGELGFGLELDLLQGSFDYVTLNGIPREVDFALQQLAAKAHLAPLESLEFAVGLGLSRLERSLEGFQTAEINAANLGANQGVAKASTLGWLVMGEALYRLQMPRFGFEAGLRYGYAPHAIDRDDPRPALDAALRPVASTFDVGGLAYLFILAVRF